MKRKNWITELILAAIFIAATASAGGVYYTPLVPKTFECLVFEIDIHQLRAVEADDARFDEIMKQVVKVCKKVEPDCEIVLK